MNKEQGENKVRSIFSSRGSENSTKGGKEGSMAEYSGRRTRNPEAPSSSIAVVTYWICSRSSQARILDHACK